MGRIEFRLTPAEMAILNRPLNGTGGFQSFGRALQASLGTNGSISLTDAQVGRIIRHISNGPGGFEDRLKDAFGRSIREVFAI
jgi:hypothetical protein